MQVLLKNDSIVHIGSVDDSGSSHVGGAAGHSNNSNAGSSLKHSSSNGQNLNGDNTTMLAEGLLHEALSTQAKKGDEESHNHTVDLDGCVLLPQNLSPFEVPSLLQWYAYAHAFVRQTQMAYLGIYFFLFTFYCLLSTSSLLLLLSH